MTPEQLDILRECCRDDAAFARLEQILLVNETDNEQGHSSFRSVAQNNAAAEQAEELQESERRFRQLAETIQQVFWMLELRQPENKMIYVSPAYEEIWGCTRQSLYEQPKSFLDIIHPEDRNHIISSMEKLSRGECVGLDYRLVRPDGSIRWIRDRGFPVKNESGQVYRCCGVAEDVTEHKQTEDSLRQQTEQARLLGVMRDRIRQSLNLDEILSTTAAEVRQFLVCDRVLVYRFQPDWGGVVVVESVGSEWKSMFAESIRDDWFVENSVRQYQQGRIFIADDTHTAGLTECHYNLMAQFEVRANLVVPIILDGGILWGLLTAHHCSAPRQWQPSEINLLQQLANQVAIAIQQAQLYQQLSATNTKLERQVQERTIELQKKIQELQELNDLKDDFLSTVSHELRTPLTNMKMAIQLLKIPSSPERQQRYLEILQVECNREAELINDLLDLQRLEATSPNLLLSETINIPDWLPSIIEPFRSRLLARQQTLQLNLPLDLPPLVSDTGGLARVLTELLNNACKYTGSGGEINLSVEHKTDVLKATSSVQPVVVFTVSNQAEIPAAVLSRIFEKFYRVPHADPWKQGGTGLGLALVQKLVKQLGGTIQVESDGGWTTFTVEIKN